MEFFTKRRHFPRVLARKFLGQANASSSRLRLSWSLPEALVLSSASSSLSASRYDYAGFWPYHSQNFWSRAHLHRFCPFRDQVRDTRSRSLIRWEIARWFGCPQHYLSLWTRLKMSICPFAELPLRLWPDLSYFWLLLSTVSRLVAPFSHWKNSLTFD